MAIEVSLQLPEGLIAHARRLSSATQRELDTVLSDALEMFWLPVEELPGAEAQLPVSALSDEAVIALANSKMDQVQNQRLGDLQSKGKTTGLTEAERYELFSLLQIYQIGQLRKSEALAEAAKRGLQGSLPG